jgi:hypothetical protein
MYAANYYELAYILKAVIEGAMADGKDYTKGEVLRDQLLEIKAFPSVYGGKVTINEDGSCQKAIAVFEVQNGKPVVIKTIK